MKKCKQCELEKDDSEFRIRTEARHRTKKAVRKIYYYLMNICRQCEKQNARKYYQDNHDSCLRKAREYAKSTREIQTIKEKQRRYPNGKITKKYSIYRQKYYRANKERILNNHKSVARKSFIKQRDNLTDWYVIMLATQKRGNNSGLTKEDFKKYPELIELYREKIKITRANRSDKFKISSQQIRDLRQKISERNVGIFENNHSNQGRFIVNKKKEAAWKKKLSRHRKDEKVIDIPTFGYL